MMFIFLSFRNRRAFIYLLIVITFLILFWLTFIRNDYLPSNTTDMEFRIVVDAGHGSIDTGTSYGDIYEKDINLAISKNLYTEIQKVNITPIMTRIEDKLYQDSRNKDIRHRPRVAVENKADLFISIHTNNFPSSQPSGSQIFYKNGSEASKELAEFIQQELIKLRNENDRANKPGDYYVLNMITCPGVIVEVGFMSNPSDRELLTSKDYQQQLARAITIGITNYLQSTFAQKEERSIKEQPISDKAEYETQVSSISGENDINEGIEFMGSCLYYLASNEKGLFLIKTDLSLPTVDFFNEQYSSHTFNEIIALEALQQLSQPPEGLLSPLPTKATVKSLSIDNKLAIVNFSRELYHNFNGGAEMEKAIIEAITKTLLSIPGIDGVEILIDGEKGLSIGGHIILDKIYK